MNVEENVGFGMENEYKDMIHTRCEVCYAQKCNS